MAINFSIQSIDIGVKALVGFGIGVLTQTNAKLWALILATQSVAELILKKTAHAIFGKKFKNVTISDYAEFATHIAAIFAIREAGLIALRTAGLFGFFASAFLLAKRMSRPQAPNRI